MANKVQESQTDLMVETKGKLELFFDNYGNKILWGLIGVALVAVAVFVAISIVDGAKQKKEDAAQAALTVAITTDAEVEAYVAVVEQYEGTNAANTAAYMVGAEYLKAGDLENAKSYLAKYTDAEGIAGEIINSLVYMLRGDVAVEENDLQTAEQMYVKALEVNNDVYTYERVANKLALTYAAMGNGEKAQQTYKAMVAKYPELKSKYSKYIAE